MCHLNAWSAKKGGATAKSGVQPKNCFRTIEITRNKTIESYATWKQNLQWKQNLPSDFHLVMLKYKAKTDCSKIPQWATWFNLISSSLTSGSRLSRVICHELQYGQVGSSQGLLRGVRNHATTLDDIQTMDEVFKPSDVYIVAPCSAFACWCPVIASTYDRAAQSYLLRWPCKSELQVQN